MILPVVAIFLLVSVFSFFNTGNRFIQKNLPFLLLLTVMVLISTFRPSYMPDYKNYLLFFNRFVDGDRFEIGFVFITNIIKRWTSNPLYFFAFFALITISLKLWAIRKLSLLPWLSIAIYVSNIYILHDMIQMRCAVASGLLLWALKFIYDRKLIPFLIITFFAFCFHYSTLVIFPLWFIRTEKTQRQFYLLIIPISYILALSNVFFSSFVKIIFLDSIQNLWTMYSSKREHFVVVNIFNWCQIIRCLICVFLWYYVERIIKVDRFLLLLLKVYTISIIFVVLFSDFPILAYRSSEFLLLGEILLIPSICFVLKGDPVLARFSVVFIGLIFLLVNIYSTKILY